MPGRKFDLSSLQYRYGFNKKENDNEVKGEGNQQDYGMRIYDPRLGKFLSIDPLTREYAMFSPYQFAGNRPIVAIDLEGLEPQEHPYQLDPIGKVHLGTTQDGKVYETYQVNSASYGNGKTWVAKIQEEQPLVNGMQMKPIDHFMYFNTEASEWQPWQRGDEPSIRHKQTVSLVNGIGLGFYGIVAIGASLPATTFAGGSSLLSTNSVFTSKFAVGAGSDLLTQFAQGGKINWVSVGANGFLANPFASSFIGSTLSLTTDGFDVNKSGTDIVLGTALGGTFGSGINKLGSRFSIAGSMKWNEKAAVNIGNTIFSFWGGAAANLSQQALVPAIQPDSQTQNNDPNEPQR